LYPTAKRHVLFKVNVLLNAVVPHNREVYLLLNEVVPHSREVDVLLNSVVPHSREDMSYLKWTSF